MLCLHSDDLVMLLVLNSCFFNSIILDFVSMVLVDQEHLVSLPRNIPIVLVDEDRLHDLLIENVEEPHCPFIVIFRHGTFLMGYLLIF